MQPYWMQTKLLYKRGFGRTRQAPVEILDPVLSFRGHAYSRAGVAAFTTSTGYGIAKYDNPEELSVSDRNNIGYQYTDCPLY